MDRETTDWDSVKTCTLTVGQRSTKHKERTGGGSQTRRHTEGESPFNIKQEIRKRDISLKDCSEKPKGFKLSLPEDVCIPNMERQLLPEEMRIYSPSPWLCFRDS